MSSASRQVEELTPLGNLDEGEIHALLGYQLAQAAIVTTGAFERVAGKPFELRPVEFTILQLVRQNPELTATQLAKALAITTPGVTSWIDRLESRGLVKRQRSVHDRRAQHVRLTRRGAELVGSVLKSLLQADRELLSHMSPGEQRMLIELLS
jgi:DNA-binding MarR family transcriptional regulator